MTLDPCQEDLHPKLSILAEQAGPDLLKGFKVLLLENIHRVALDFFTRLGAEVETRSGAVGSESLKAVISDFDILGIRSKTTVSADVIKSASKLRLICCFCAGTDQVDLNAASEAGIIVFNSPYANGSSVVELIICEIICLSRNLTKFNESIHSGVWLKSAVGSHLIEGKLLGIIGFGNIGVKVARCASALGMNVQYYDIVKKEPVHGASSTTLESLLRTSDFVTIHVPGSDDIKGMIGEKQLRMMKKGSFLLNASRGCVVDIKALAHSLKTGHLAGAAIDVYPQEPKKLGDKFYTELSGLPNVILTPHIGGSTEEAQENVSIDMLHSIVHHYVYGSAINSLNITPLTLLPPSAGTARIICCHRNIPGALKEINRILAGFNIARQTSSSKGPMAYAVIDFELSSYDLDKLDGCIDEIRLIPECLWARSLLS